MQVHIYIYIYIKTHYFNQTTSHHNHQSRVDDSPVAMGVGVGVARR